MGTAEDKLRYLNDTKVKIREAMQARKINVTEEDTFRSYADKILHIPDSLDTSDATATPGDILSPKTAYARGEKITGTIRAAYEQSIGTELEDRTVGQYLIKDYYGLMFSEDGLMCSNLSYSSNPCGYTLHVWDGTKYVKIGSRSFDYYPYAISAFGFNGNPDECLMAGRYWSSSSSTNEGVYKFNKSTVTFTSIYSLSRYSYLDDSNNTRIFICPDGSARIIGVSPSYSGALYYADLADGVLVRHGTVNVGKAYPATLHILNKNVILAIYNVTDVDHYNVMTKVILMNDGAQIMATKDFPGMLTCSRSSDYCIYNGKLKRIIFDILNGIVELIDVPSSINIPIPIRDTSGSYSIDAGFLYDKVFYTFNSKTNKIEIYNVDIQNDLYSKHLSVYGVYNQQKDMCIPYDTNSARTHGRLYTIVTEGTNKLIGFTINEELYNKVNDGDAGTRDIASGKIAFTQYGRIVGSLPTNMSDYTDCIELSNEIAGPSEDPRIYNYNFGNMAIGLMSRNFIDIIGLEDIKIKVTAAYTRGTTGTQINILVMNNNYSGSEVGTSLNIQMKIPSIIDDNSNITKSISINVPTIGEVTSSDIWFNGEDLITNTQYNIDKCIFSIT